MGLAELGAERVDHERAARVAKHIRRRRVRARLAALPPACVRLLIPKQLGLAKSPVAEIPVAAKPHLVPMAGHGVEQPAAGAAVPRVLLAGGHRTRGVARQVALRDGTTQLAVSVYAT